MRAEAIPRHLDGCDGTEQWGPCSGCLWEREAALDWAALQRWYMLFRGVLRSPCEGWGRG